MASDGILWGVVEKSYNKTIILLREGNMNLRKMKKQFKQESGFLFGEHDQIAFIKRTSKLYEHDSPKFPHRKWANIKYREIKTEAY